MNVCRVVAQLPVSALRVRRAVRVAAFEHFRAACERRFNFLHSRLALRRPDHFCVFPHAVNLHLVVCAVQVVRLRPSIRRVRCTP